MRVRDAVEADAGAMAALADQPADVMRNLVHDRTVRVAIDRPAEAGSDEQSAVDTGDLGAGSGKSGDNPPADSDKPTGTDHRLRALVSFDARQETVHITQIAGDRQGIERLLEEPIRFARREGMDVEAIVSETDETGKTAVEAKGFDRIGEGPRFEGEPTSHYRLEE